MTGSDMPALLKALAGARISGDDRKKQKTEADKENVKHVRSSPPIRAARHCARAARELRE
jgi:hypothetical protein